VSDWTAVVAAIAGGGILILLLLYVRFRSQGTRLKRALERSGERLLFGPEVGYYQGTIRGIVSLSTYGVIALTDRRLVFTKPIGGDIDIALSQVAGIAENKWFAGNYHNGRKFLILKLADGTEKAFQVKNHDGWMRELGSRVSAT
jgi:hypothetical protein